LRATRERDSNSAADNGSETDIVDSDYELFDLAPGNTIEVYEDERDAVDALIGVVSSHGFEVIATCALTFIQSGRPTLVAMEDGLVLGVQRELQNLVPSQG
jgi:hypothetical protein